MTAIQTATRTMFVLGLLAGMFLTVALPVLLIADPVMAGLCGAGAVVWLVCRA